MFDDFIVLNTEKPIFIMTSQHFYERVKSWYCLTFGSYFRCYYVNYDYVIILVLNIFLSWFDISTK